MTDPVPTLSELGERMARQAPQSLALGMQFVSAGGGVAAMKVPYRDDLVGDPATGVIAGGVITTLLDHTCGMAISTALAERGLAAGPAMQMGGMATLDLRIDYMRPAHPKRDIFGRAHCYKLTRSVAFVRATAFEDDPDDPIATAQAAFMLTGAPQEPGR